MKRGLVVDVLRVLCVLVAVGSVTLAAPNALSEDLSEERVLRDPTKPYRFVAPAKTVSLASSSFKVSYIKQSGDAKVAVVNGQSVKEGDYVGGMKVIQIADKGVRLKGDGRSYWAALHSKSGITKK